ncbi:unnamed protein product [Closterium sp. Yama58-4]|nr:unnamed protein product [Closterium sp. Yama58-4]
MRCRFTMTSSPLLQLASQPSPLPLAYDARPSSLRGGNDFWAFFQQRQDKLEETTRQSFSDQSEASACSELRDNPEGPKAIEDPRLDEDGQVDDQQSSLPKRRPLGPPVQGSYLSKREDDKGRKPLFSFGVITDVQYADINDGQSFLGIPRFYRHSLEVVKKAVEDWNQSTPPMSFAVHFGDIVDGFCPRDRSEEAVNTVLDALAGFTAGPTYHMIGNHCLYNLPRVTLNKMLAIPTAADNRSYYDFSPFPNFRFVVLDSYDVSLLGWPEDHPHAVKAREVMERENPNEEKNSPEGLEGLNRRFVKFNGGVGEEQLRCPHPFPLLTCIHPPRSPPFLPPPTPQVLATIHRHECVAAVIAGHAHFGAYALDARGIHDRILEGAVECPPSPDTLFLPPSWSPLSMWSLHALPSHLHPLAFLASPSPPQVLATIHRHECVAAVIAGHAHFGAYALDARGIHHRILEGAVECPPGTVAFGRVDVYRDRLCIIGTDRMLCTEMKFPSRASHYAL